MIPTPEPGSIFAGKYKIEKVIGSGGMGVILSATHVHLEQRVAIKLLTPATAPEPARLGRFSREAKAAARIQSEHVVRILDYGTHASGAPFIVMEHLEGIDLAMTLETRGALPVDEAVDYILQACDGVAEAHHAGIIHRDLKPANLFLARKKDGSSTLKVLDFGASKLTADCSLAANDPSLTDASSLIGSPRYMAPEQLQAADGLDSRADIYALGATLFELLAGEALFTADTISRIFTKILWEEPPSITQFREDVPEGLVEILFKCLQKRADDRFQTVKELVVALGEFAPARCAVLIAQVARIGEPPVSIAPPRNPVMKRQISADHSPPAAHGPPAGRGEGAASMDTMAVLRAAQIDSWRPRFAALVGALVAVLGLAAAVVVLAVRPRSHAASSSPQPPTSVAAATEALATNVPPVPETIPTAAPAVDAGEVAPTSSSSGAASNRPRAADRRAADRVPATTSKAASGSPSSAATKPNGDFAEFGNRK